MAVINLDKSESAMAELNAVAAEHGFSEKHWMNRTGLSHKFPVLQWTAWRGAESVTATWIGTEGGGSAVGPIGCYQSPGEHRWLKNKSEVKQAMAGTG
jgi:hypothetical protein